MKDSAKDQPNNPQSKAIESSGTKLLKNDFDPNYVSKEVKNQLRMHLKQIFSKNKLKQRQDKMNSEGFI